MFSRRWCYSTSFWFLLLELLLVISENQHFPRTAFARVEAQCPHCRCLCSRVTCALLLLLSLTSLPGVPGWWALTLHLGFPEPQAPPPLGGVEGWGVPGLWALLPCPVLSGSWAALVWSGSGVPDSRVPPQLEGWEHRFCFHCCQVICDCGHCCGWEARVVCAASPAATRFSGAVGSAAAIRGSQLQAPPLLFLQFHLLYVFQFSHL